MFTLYEEYLEKAVLGREPSSVIYDEPEVRLMTNAKGTYLLTSIDVPPSWSSPILILQRNKETRSSPQWWFFRVLLNAGLRSLTRMRSWISFESCFITASTVARTPSVVLLYCLTLSVSRSARTFIATRASGFSTSSIISAVTTLRSIPIASFDC